MVWFDFFTDLSLEKEKKNLRLLKVKLGNKTINPFCRVFPINAASYASILDLLISERLYPISMGLG